ncbi:YaiI/YqxD family protein [Evansella cellulosilytica]|uniref:Uncharacterized protein n=1 Tax=Evansella cellulosilytica (strain ATCC 21833 / DSM 2522 / FERM P-1141 / JCM 9156 / N-4) TaxID=649639 RepID=E6TW54_EVAC2|nr:DUF188 domain-containing protein [Evansella cellulosilytica]ADU29877.1 protein of unknown function DUF188 [Evansella cellulosilytica DSM 2522]
MQNKNVKIFVDGDACPVLEEILSIAHKNELSVIFISSYAHATNKSFPYFVECIYVDQDREAADLKIANSVMKGDIAITDDLGLTSLLLAKGVLVLTSRGKLITNREIEYLMDFRYQSAKRRRSGEKTKGPKKLLEQDKCYFKEQLQKILSF